MVYNYNQTEEQLVNVFKDFYAQKGDWPRSQEISATARLLQRKYGGVPAFRKKHNLGYEDYTKGLYRSEQTRNFNIRANGEEDKLYLMLVKKYGKVNVHREYLIHAGRKMRADFLIFKDGNEFLTIDCFYPKDEHTLKGCLRVKAVKYKNYHFTKVVFIQMNPNINEKSLDEIIGRKKNMIEENQYLLSLKEFINKGFVV